MNLLRRQTILDAAECGRRIKFSARSKQTRSQGQISLGRFVYVKLLETRPDNELTRNM